MFLPVSVIKNLSLYNKYKPEEGLLENVTRFTLLWEIQSPRRMVNCSFAGRRR